MLTLLLGEGDWKPFPWGTGDMVVLDGVNDVSDSLERGIGTLKEKIVIFYCHANGKAIYTVKPYAVKTPAVSASQWLGISKNRIASTSFALAVHLEFPLVSADYVKHV